MDTLLNDIRNFFKVKITPTTNPHLCYYCSLLCSLVGIVKHLDDLFSAIYAQAFKKTYHLSMNETVKDVACTQVVKQGDQVCVMPSFISNFRWATRTDNGVSYTWDITRSMFCPGNITEKIRVAGFDCSE